MRICKSIARHPLSQILGLLFLLEFATVASSHAQKADSSVVVTIVADESDAVLSILSKKQANRSITEDDWRRLESSEGYLRLKRREASMHRDFTDTAFRGFVLSDSLLSRFQKLRTTLEAWKGADIASAAGRALAYLPAGARIKAKIYPVIKPRTNSFVFEVTSDPAIFLYIDPDVSREKFANTLAHELHHIGYAGSCSSTAARIDEDTTLSQGTRTVYGWIGAFGEGFAMLAAAGGPDVHPHLFSKPVDHERWDRDVNNFNSDLKTVERFFVEILDNKLTREQIQDTASAFFGIQGPWYTVGWKMAVTIEKTFGRSTLIDCLCDPRMLLPTYNRAAEAWYRTAGESLATWSPEFLERLRK